MHWDHEAMRLEMVLISFSALITMQVMLVQWRQRQGDSSNLVTLLQMWVVPSHFTIKLYRWYFLSLWGPFSVITKHILFRATRNHFQGKHHSSSLNGNFQGKMGRDWTSSAALMAESPLWMTTTQRQNKCRGLMDGDNRNALWSYTVRQMPTRSLSGDTCAICGQTFVAPDEEGLIENTCKLSGTHIHPSHKEPFLGFLEAFDFPSSPLAPSPLPCLTHR
ncbi:RING finger protein 175 [Lemmus lemmus]